MNARQHNRSEEFFPNVKAVMFCLSTPSIKTRVHFFPASTASTSHQPIACVLTLFGKGIEKRSVMLEGGRLNQPDGIRLEDAFPTLRNEASGIFGLEVQLISQQGRANLLHSQAAVELVSANANLLYASAPFLAEESNVEGAVAPAGDLGSKLEGVRRKSFVGVGLQDSAVTTSLIMINSTTETIRPAVFHGVGEEAHSLPVGNMVPESAMEIPLDDALFKNSIAHECLWGLSRAEKISIGSDAVNSNLGFYLMYREPVSKRPLSVCAL